MNSIWIIRYTDQLPSPEDLYKLYESEGWNDFLNLTKEHLHKAMVQSWYVISAYDDDHLIGTGRIISDGIINANICGLIVHHDYRNLGIGSKMVQKLVNKSREMNLQTELFCEEKNVTYYEKFNFEAFAIGMKVRS